MCDKAVLGNDRIFKSVLDCQKNHKISTKVVGCYPHALESVPECYKAHKMSDKAVDTPPPLTITYVLESYKTQEMSYKAVQRCFVYLNLFLINIKVNKYVS